MNGFKIYTEKLPYLQTSFLHLIQRESQEYRSQISICRLRVLDKKHDLPGLAFVRRGVNGGKVIEEGFTGRLKRWRHNKKIKYIQLQFQNIYRKITIFTILFSVLDSEGKSEISFIKYSLIGLPFSDAFMHTTPPRQKS